MIITRSRRLVIQPKQYESIEVAASIQIDETEARRMARDADAEDVPQFLDDYLSYLLEGEMEEAAKVTTNERSIINTYRYPETDTETDRK